MKLLFVLIALSGLALADDFEKLPERPLSWEQTSGIPRVGDTLRFHFDGDAGITVDLPPGKSDLIDEGWTLLPSNSPGEILAVPIKPGNETLPPLLLKDPSGQGVARTNAVNVNVESAISKTDPRPTQAETAQPPLGLKFPLWAALVLSVFGGALFLTAFFFGYREWRRWRARRPRRPEIVKTEDEIALATLQEIETRNYVASGKFKPHYFQISETLKIYLGRRYDFDAPERTSDEVIEELRKIPHSSRVNDLQTLFEKLDFVKFTDNVPEASMARQVLKDARQFVLATKRIPIEPNNSPSNSNGETRASS